MVRKILAKLVLRLRAEGLSGRAIAASQGMSRKSIIAVLEAADPAAVGWDDVVDSSHGEVYALWSSKASPAPASPISAASWPNRPPSTGSGRTTSGMPDLEEAWALARDKPQGQTTLKK